MNKVYVFNETSEDLKKEEKEIAKILKYALKEEKVKNAECNVIFVDNEKIHEINKTYRNIDRETDVISFALEDNLDVVMAIRLLGDIYISVDKAHEQAESYGHSFRRELSFLAVHGLLHLLGYNHEEKEDEIKMFARQEEVLTHYGITRSL